MFHHPHHYGWADQVRRQQTERLHAQMPIEPLYDPRTTPMWCWAVMGVGIGLLIVLHLMGVL